MLVFFFWFGFIFTSLLVAAIDGSTSVVEHRRKLGARSTELGHFFMLLSPANRKRTKENQSIH